MALKMIGEPRVGKTRAPREDALLASKQDENSPLHPLAQDGLGIASLIAAHRDASRTHLLAGLRDHGAYGAAELALGRFYARRAEALALLAGGR